MENLWQCINVYKYGNMLMANNQISKSKNMGINQINNITNYHIN